MAIIGTFKPTATGFEGAIATLMTNKKVRFVANEKKKTENSPDYFVKSGRCDLGVAWNDVTEPDDDTRKSRSNPASIILSSNEWRNE